MSFSQAEWLSELAHAAEDLGYIIERFDERSVTLAPSDGSTREHITFESIFMSGDYLRSVLKPVRVTVGP